MTWEQLQAVMDALAKTSAKTGTAESISACGQADRARGAVVTLEAEVLRPGKYSWHEGMHLTELLSGLNSLKEDTDQRYILVRREHFPAIATAGFHAL